MNDGTMRPIGTIVTTLTVIAVMTPVLIVAPMSLTTGSTVQFPPDGLSLKWYEAALNDPVWLDRIWVSLRVAVFVTVIAVLIGTMAAYALVRFDFPGKGLVWALVLGPLLVPLVVLGTGEFFVLATGWSLGPLHFGGGLAGTVPGLILAHTVLAFPYPTILVATSLRSVDDNLERAAASLGAGPIHAFRLVTLPLIVPGLVGGAVFAFLASWDEVVVASFLTNSQVSTVPVGIFAGLNQTLDPTAAAISTLLLLVGLVALVVTGMAGRKRETSRSAEPVTAPGDRA